MGLGGRGGDAAAVWNLEASKARGWPVEEHSAGSWVFAGEALHRRRLVGHHHRGLLRLEGVDRWHREKGEKGRGR